MRSNDQTRTQASAEWWNGLQKAPASLPEKADKCVNVLEGPGMGVVGSRQAWQARREEIRKKWLGYLGEIPKAGGAVGYKVIESDTKAGVLRELISYEAEPGLPVEGYLLRPLAGASAKPVMEKRPGAVVFHSTVDYTIRQPAGLEGPENKWIGLQLARQGYVVFCPRCYLWQYGEPKNLVKAVSWLHRRHPMVKGMTKMLFDGKRAVDLLESLPEVNRRRIAAVGHSLGAKEVLYLAAFDERIQATVSSEGGIGIDYSNWDAPWYLDQEIRDKKAELNHAELLALVAPRAFLLMGGDSADGDISWPYVEAALPAWKLTGAGGGIGLWNHRLGHAFPPEAMEHTLEWFEKFLNG